MRPASPVAPGTRCAEVVFAKDQPPYIPLPAVLDGDGTAHTRWRLAWWERFRVLLTGNVYVSLKTFNKPLQPIRLGTGNPIRRQIRELRRCNMCHELYTGLAGDCACTNWGKP